MLRSSFKKGRSSFLKLDNAFLMWSKWLTPIGPCSSSFSQKTLDKIKWATIYKHIKATTLNPEIQYTIFHTSLISVTDAVSLSRRVGVTHLQTYNNGCFRRFRKLIMVARTAFGEHATLNLLVGYSFKNAPLPLCRTLVSDLLDCIDFRYILTLESLKMYD